MRLYYLIGSLLLVAGCQDASNNKPNVDSTEKAEMIQETQPVNDTDDQYSADGLTPPGPMRPWAPKASHPSARRR